jgi:hypothetical protein
VELVQGDIADVVCLQRYVRGCQQVFHLAGYAKNWARDPKTYFRINVQGMRNVFRAARENDMQRIVWTSSNLTSGPTARGVVGDETTPRSSDRFFTEGENGSLKAFFRTIDRVSGKRHWQWPVLHMAPLLFATLQKKRAEWLVSPPESHRGG